MNTFNSIENTQIIPDPFADIKEENILLPMDYKLTKEERKEAVILFKKLIILSYEKDYKRFIGLPEHIIYNFLRNKPIFNGINKIRDNNYAVFSEYSFHYGEDWYYLPTHRKSKEFHQKLSKILGFKYEKVMKALSERVKKEFKNVQ